MDKRKKLIITAVAAAVIVAGVAVGAAMSRHPGGFGRHSNGKIVVCLDAGHGGSDNGAQTADGRLEKDDNLRLTLAVGDVLADKGIKVIYTRKTDSYLTPQERYEFANDENATLFVAIHRNSADAQVSGIEAWIEKSSPRDDSVLAKNILAAIDEVGYGENRGVQSGYRGNPNANYAVNGGTECPSCLLEMGFMSTPGDNELFDKNFDEYANAIAQGIIETLNKWN